MSLKLQSHVTCFCQYKVNRGTRLAKLVKDVTPDLRVMSPGPTLGVQLLKKYTGEPGWLNRQSVQISISGLWVRALCWVYRLLKKINYK